MKIYLAAAYSRRAEMEKYADQLKALGHEITARWVYGGEEGLTYEDIAILDLDDLDKANVVLSFTYKRGTPSYGGGRHVEFGYALAKGKKLDLIGYRENVFHHWPTVTLYETFEDWLKHTVTDMRRPITGSES